MFGGYSFATICAGAGVTGFGWPDDQIIPHGEVGRLREKYHLTGKSIAERIRTELGKNS